ncbi:MAG TPA: fumarylacetoacetate hydrolase family protein, partial [Phycisphaerales bacterium]|nr:fumarylacetoacetate hydrolase family protein [Phycisphaerales bacterium]
DTTRARGPGFHGRRVGTTLRAMFNLIRTELGIAIQSGPGETTPIRHIIGVGRNYADHAREQNADVPDRPMLFTKNPYSASLDGDDIVIPRICQDREQVDFEAELAVVIGRGPGGRLALDVSEDEAARYVLGYCCANDVSARWWQKEGSGGQFCRGKGFDTFCPLGPVVVPPEKIPDPGTLRVVCRVNGLIMQDAPTSDMIFSVQHLVSACSQGTTLLPGTVILTGTPSGVGMARKPPVYLKAGDRVEVEIDRIGLMANTVRIG